MKRKISIKKYIQNPLAGGIALLFAALLAVGWASSPMAASYHAFFDGDLRHGISLHKIINDGFMALFFLLVGCELKREFMTGALSSVRKATLPIAAAIGGMAVPAAVYLLIVGASEGLHQGWAVPTATDIAFALAALALLARGAPPALRAFLLALAIIDDLGAVLIIGLFYTSELNAAGLVAALLLMVCLWALRFYKTKAVSGASPIWPYLLLGMPLWGAIASSGLHATLAGVLLAFMMPLTAATKLEHKLAPLVVMGVMPLFALANAGIDLTALSVNDFSNALTMGVLLGLAVGKPLGILAGAWLAVRCGIAQLPQSLSWRHVAGLGALGGIGFTMSLFIAELAFDGWQEQAHSRLGIISGSLIATFIGWLLLKTRKDGKNGQ